MSATTNLSEDEMRTVLAALADGRAGRTGRFPTDDDAAVVLRWAEGVRAPVPPAPTMARAKDDRVNSILLELVLEGGAVLDVNEAGEILFRLRHVGG